MLQLYLFSVLQPRRDCSVKSKIRFTPLGNDHDEDIQKLKTFKASNATCRVKRDEIKLRSLIEEDKKRSCTLAPLDSNHSDTVYLGRFQGDVRQLANELEAELEAENFEHVVLVRNHGSTLRDLLPLLQPTPSGFDALCEQRSTLNAEVCLGKLPFRSLDRSRVKWSDPGRETDFSDLRINGAEGYDIPETKARAIKPSQLDTILQHINNRLRQEKWKGRDGDLEKVSDINLYAACDYVIKPATCKLPRMPLGSDHLADIPINSSNRRPCSLVELMAADSPQPPDYFVSQ